MNRLATIAPKLSQTLRNTDTAKLQSVKLAACNYVIQNTNEPPSELVSHALQQLNESGSLSKDIRDKLAAIAYGLDEKYFQFYEEDPEDEDAYLPFLTKARTLNAIAYAGEDDPYDSAVEAIYEICMVTRDRDSFIAYLESLL